MTITVFRPLELCTEIQCEIELHTYNTRCGVFVWIVIMNVEYQAITSVRCEVYRAKRPQQALLRNIDLLADRNYIKIHNRKYFLAFLEYSALSESSSSNKNTEIPRKYILNFKNFPAVESRPK